MKRFIYVALSLLIGFGAWTYASRTPLEYPLIDTNVVMLTSPINHQTGGTGFVLQAEGYNVTITNRHVCNLAFQNRLSASKDQGKTWIDLPIVKIETGKPDLCMLIAYPGLPGLTLSLLEPQTNDHVYTIGYPRLHPRRRTYGDFVTLELESDEDDLPEAYLVTTPIQPGNSGSPLLNSDNKVIGVIFALNVVTYDGYAVTLPQLSRFISQDTKQASRYLKGNKLVTHALGVSF